MKVVSFDEAFRPSADDISRGDGYLKGPIIPFKEYPEFGKVTTISDRITNIKEYIEDQAKLFKSKYAESTSKPTENKVNDEFEYIRLLGSGSFGNVEMIKRISTGIYYARKRMAKLFLVKSNKVGDIINEKKLLNSLRYPFTVHLKFYYKDYANIYLLLPLIAGGDLFNYIKSRRNLGERLVKFISSQVFLALEYLHCIGLMHRDLKLENILIDHYGYIKLTDFGMSKLLSGKRTYTICGTAEYMAPEVITQKGYGFAAEWWSFGVLIYELCNGLSPFYASEVIQIFSLITHCDYSMPLHFSSLLRNLIVNLLQVDLTRRLGNLKNGANDIKNHLWYKSVPWLLIINQQIASPMVPFISDDQDNRFFQHEPQAKVITETTDLYTKEFENF